MKKEIKSARSSKRWLLQGAQAVVIVGLIAFGGFYFSKYENLKKNPPAPEESAKVQQDKIIEQVSKLYKLPEGEEPTIFTVVDTEKLKQQYPALSASEKDDKVLLYSTAKVALLYRPKDNKLVSVVNVSVAAKMTVRIVGPQALRDSAKAQLGAKFPEGIDYKGLTDAKGNYPSTIVVDVNGKASEQAKQVASALGANAAVGGLPEGEDKPTDAEILVIVGQSASTQTNPAP